MLLFVTLLEICLVLHSALQKLLLNTFHFIFDTWTGKEKFFETDYGLKIFEIFFLVFY